MPSANSINNSLQIKQQYRLLFLSFFALIWVACENNIKNIPALRKKQIGVEIGKDIESYYSVGAKVKAKLTSPYMVRYLTDSPYVEFPKTMHVDFYNDTMRIQTRMDAKYGKYYQYDDRVFLRDSVIVKNSITGDTLKTNELWWDKKKQLLYNDKPSYIFKKDGTQLFAKDGLEAAQDLSSYSFKNVSGPVSVPANGLPK
ncbi:MAG TPA: LPS export ABC transporter periplasmic protein LptC [Puia sp.]|nr:LPS export ABC transporter periplasmic protein LptC [Puia sp.]